MKIFVINLDKNVERLRLMGERLAVLGLEFIRFPAVYGKELTAKERKKLVSMFKWWCARGSFPRPGEIGAVTSHLMVYRRLLGSGDGYCCVLEDDDQLDKRFKEQLERIEKWIEPSRPQVVLLTNYSKEHADAEWEVKPSAGDSSAEAYVITRAAAAALLRHNSPAKMPSDCWRFWVQRRVIELYHAFPTVVPSTWQLPGYVSDVCPIGEKQVRVREMGIIRKFLWKIQRLIGRVLARFIV